MYYWADVDQTLKVCFWDQQQQIGHYWPNFEQTLKVGLWDKQSTTTTTLKTLTSSSATTTTLMGCDWIEINLVLVLQTCPWKFVSSCCVSVFLSN